MQIWMAAWFLVGGAVGGAVGWLILKSRTQAASVTAAAQMTVRDFETARLREVVTAHEQTLQAREKELQAALGECGVAREDAAGLRARMAAEQKATADTIAALQEVERSLKSSFEALAANALDANSRRLMQLTAQQMEKQQVEANRELLAKETAIETILKPMQESLAKLSTHSQELEIKREGAYTAVLAEIQNMQRSHTDLRKETTQLVQALRSPKARGNWGELQLRKCVEFAGMVQHASFEVERFIRGEEAGYRPDLVVKMPNGRTIIVDAKTPLDAFLDASTAEDEVLRSAKLVAHAAQVRSHLKDLSSKGYWRQFVDSPDFVVCFLPSEVLFSAALEQDPSLIEYSASSGVLLATPTTLIALLKAVACGWQQSEVAKNAHDIRETALTIYSKLAGLHGDFVDLGKKLKTAGEAYDGMLTKAEGRGGIFSVSRKMKELGIGEKELPELKPIGLTLKMMQSEDWRPILSLAGVAKEKTQ